MPSNPDLRLNLIPITFNNDTFRGYELVYQNDKQLKELREKYFDTHVFRRQGNIIQCVPLNETAEAFSSEKEFNLKEHFVLAEYLVQHTLIQFFLAKKAKLSHLYHPTTIVIDKENLMKEVLNCEEIADFLAMYPKYEIEAKLIVPYEREVVFGIQINFGVCHLFKASIKNFIAKKIDLLNRYVEIETNNDSNLIINQSFNRKLAGRIVAIDGSTLKLTDFRDRSEVDAEECFLEPSITNFLHCLISSTHQDIEEVQKNRLLQIFKVTGAKYQYKRLEKLKDWLAKSQPFYCASNLSFTLNPDIYQPKFGNEAGEYRRLTNPSYVLRPGGSITVTGKIDKEIDTNGPFDTESFPKKRVKVAVVFPERFKGEIEVFIRQFKDGVPPINSRELRSNKEIAYTQGFVRKYRLTSCEFDFFPINRGSENPKGYKEASLESLKNQLGYDLAMVVIREEWHSLDGDKNPYLVAKSTFMSQGIPVQCVEIETIQDERGRRWILNNLALATYGKLGGIPWVLSSTPGMTHELIFGIGSSITRSERLGATERFVGITTVFNGDGNYLLYNLTKEVRYEHYQDALLQSLNFCLNEVKARYGWQAGDKVRLIFHQSFKKFKNIEAQAVKQFVNSLTDFEVEYAFVHISKSHSWKVFDQKFKGVQYWEDNQQLVRGEYVPQRGFYLPLGPQAALLTLTGAYQLKNSLQGLPEPILISVHNESTFSSQEYLVNQIYKLTFMSWRSFFPSTTPVTIEYSDLIAKFMGQLRNIPNWNPDLLNTKLRESRWFL